MTSKRRLLLFDIDGTLIHSGGAGSRALNRAVEEVVGVKDGFKGINFAGKTDLEIIKEGLAHQGLPMDENMVRRVVERYLDLLKEEVPRAPSRLMPGIPRVLEDLQGKWWVHLGLLTGNLNEGARIKLERFDLNRFFPIGAFGSDSEDRNQLLPVALYRLADKTGIRLSPSQCIVIGDTPRDVACAKVHGAASIAVATGPYCLEDLRRTGADVVVKDLNDVSLIPELIEEALNRNSKGRKALTA